MLLQQEEKLTNMIIFTKNKGITHNGNNLKTIVRAIKTIDEGYVTVPINTEKFDKPDAKLNLKLAKFLLTKNNSVNSEGLNRYYIDSDDDLYEIDDWVEHIEDEE